jgi:signal transduction histidine kinase
LGVLVAVVAAALVALVAVAVGGTLLSARSYRSAESLAADRERASNRMLSGLLDAETASRGYALTRDAAQLARLTAARVAFPADAEELYALVAGDADLDATGRELGRIGGRWLAASDERIQEPARTGPRRGGREPARAERRQRLASRFVRQHALLAEQVEERRRAALDQADDRRALMLGAIGGVAVLAVIGVGAAARRAWRGVGGPLRALEAGVARVAAGQLSEPVSAPPAAAGELASVTQGFNRMQARLAGLIEELRMSRSRIVAAGDGARRRLERDLHDGAQQRLVAVSLRLGMARVALDDDPAEAGRLLDEGRSELAQAFDELRELARGIHPAILTERGLEPALRALAARAPLPVEVTAPPDRLPPDLEAAVYFVAAESVTNLIRHAGASSAAIVLERREGRVSVEIRDDGRGGAEVGTGSGLVGLTDRVAALDGTLGVVSPAGGGTVVRAEFPCA